MSPTRDDAILSAPHAMEYPYKRSLGPVLSRFFTGLRDGRTLGNKTKSGRVLVPPMEYDPETGDDTSDEFVEVGPGGVVQSWSWVREPRKAHILDRPFAWALIQLDGADVPMLHAVDAGNESAMQTGMRVELVWADERVGRIQDIACFVPEGSGR